jgi:transposase
VQADVERCQTDTRTARLYKALLACGRRVWPGDLEHVLRCEAWERRCPLPTTDLGSLTGIVAALMALDMPLARLRAVSTLKEPELMHCTNHACPQFGAARLLPYDVRERGDGSAGMIGSYCGTCGSLYHGGRLLASFDDQSSPGSAYPKPTVILQARGHLESWRQRLIAACEEMLVDGEMISTANAFRRAGLLDKPNLMAPRLGLLALVDEYAVRQVRLLAQEGAIAWKQPTPLREDDLKRWRQVRARHGAHRRDSERTWRTPQPSDLSDTEWRLLATLLPPTLLRGYSERDVINDILFVLCGGHTWHSVGGGSTNPAHRYCDHWRTRGMWEALRLALRELRMPFATWAAGNHDDIALPETPAGDRDR